MPLRVKKRIKETPQSLIGRFSQRLKKSGILVEARKRKFKQKKKSQQLKKWSALRRQRKKKEYKRLKKMGKI